MCLQSPEAAERHLPASLSLSLLAGSQGASGLSEVTEVTCEFWLAPALTSAWGLPSETHLLVLYQPICSNPFPASAKGQAFSQSTNPELALLHSHGFRAHHKLSLFFPTPHLSRSANVETAVPCRVLDEPDPEVWLVGISTKV